MIENKYTISEVIPYNRLLNVVPDALIEVSVTRSALEKIADYFTNGLNSKIDIWANTSGEGTMRVCTINHSFLGLMLNYNLIFRRCKEVIPYSETPTFLLYERVLINYFCLGNIAFEPRLEHNSKGNNCMVFAFPSPKIGKEQKKIKEDDVESMKIETISFDSSLIIGAARNVREYPMKIKFSANVAPNLLRLEMDFINGEWKLAAIQRGQHSLFHDKLSRRLLEIQYKSIVELFEDEELVKCAEAPLSEGN